MQQTKPKSRVFYMRFDKKLGSKKNRRRRSMRGGFGLGIGLGGQHYYGYNSQGSLDNPVPGGNDIKTGGAKKRKTKQRRTRKMRGGFGPLLGNLGTSTLLSTGNSYNAGANIATLRGIGYENPDVTLQKV